jgi:hypothetical protein
MMKNYLERMEESIMNTILNQEKGCVYVIPTGGGKTHAGILKTCKNLSNHNKKIINVILNPFDILRGRIKYDLNKLGINTYNKNEFCSTEITSNLIIINDLWQAFITDNGYKVGGDNPSFLEKINKLKENGYSVIFTIDETHIFSTLEVKKAPKAKEFINDIDPITQIHFSATPGNVFDFGLNKFITTAEEVVNLGFVKRQIVVNENESPFKRIEISLDEYESKFTEISLSEAARLQGLSTGTNKIVARTCKCKGVCKNDGRCSCWANGEKCGSHCHLNLKSTEKKKCKNC